MAEGKDPRINLVAATLKGLPPTTIITAELDPLQSDGMMLTDKLKAAGVTVDSKNWDGVTHEFFGGRHCTTGYGNRNLCCKSA